MALKIYKWRGYTWQIADEDLDKYPDAVPVDKAPNTKKQSPTTKSRRAPKNK